MNRPFSNFLQLHESDAEGPLIPIARSECPLNLAFMYCSYDVITGKVYFFLDLVLVAIATYKKYSCVNIEKSDI